MNIPEIVLSDNELHKGAAYVPSCDHIRFHIQDAFDYDTPTWEWKLLHEVGHSQNPETIKHVNFASLSSIFVTPFLWGMHRTKPYKNMFTKLGSKALATISLPILIFCQARKLEERRADNCANMHADKEALVGGVDFFERSKRKTDQVLEQIQKTNPYKSSILKFLSPILNTPMHPSHDSRITKIKDALRNRFGVEA